MAQKYEIVIFALRRNCLDEWNTSVQNICFILKTLQLMFRIYEMKNQVNNCSIYHSDLQNKAARSHCCNNKKFRWLFSKDTRSRYTTQKKNVINYSPCDEAIYLYSRMDQIVSALQCLQQQQFHVTSSWHTYIENCICHFLLPELWQRK